MVLKLKVITATIILWVNWVFGVILSACAIGSVVLGVYFLIWASGTYVSLILFFPLLMILALLFAVQPAYFLFSNRRNLSKNRFKYLFVADASEIKERMEKASKQEQKLREKEKEAVQKRVLLLMDKEKNRTATEKFSAVKIGWLLIIPVQIMVLLVAINVGYQYLAHEEFNILLSIALIVMAASVFALTLIEMEWETNLAAKDKIEKRNSNYIYTRDYYHCNKIYTDSQFEYYSYMIAKVVCYLTSAVIIVPAGVFLLIWVANIHIAPTTVIIILLTIIIIMMIQNRR